MKLENNASEHDVGGRGGGGVFVTLELHFTAVLVFNVPDTWRRNKLMSYLGIIKSFKKNIERFLIYCEICRRVPN